MDVGDLISLYRKQAGLTIDELAEKSGVPKGTLNKITGGVTKAPTLPNMKAIASALGKTLSDFDDLPIQQLEKSPTTTEAASGEILEADSLRSTLLHNFDQLNQEGQERLVETSDDMVCSGKYIKSDSIRLGKEA